ncbi:hypothetical protein PPTG_17275 [Phytophthora nicotianae INRA-310]|uniref:Uncharacterized protein n=1 Tax=Phytophthora nicotianae (strain INRA-310) TaxID=761204 RepID=W2PL27_PHYN3|nr:hypothetical protein PPTG_17275 [Phytophthora nicotianae INRA-310]ETN00949.1 hypothetical protein PPTG_17275 [Phytophthora nicotianae INRA-310]
MVANTKHKLDTHVRAAKRESSLPFRVAVAFRPSTDIRNQSDQRSGSKPTYKDRRWQTLALFDVQFLSLRSTWRLVELQDDAVIVERALAGLPSSMVQAGAKNAAGASMLIVHQRSSHQRGTVKFTLP